MCCHVITGHMGQSAHMVVTIIWNADILPSCREQECQAAAVTGWHVSVCRSHRLSAGPCDQAAPASALAPAGHCWTPFVLLQGLLTQQNTTVRLLHHAQITHTVHHTYSATKANWEMTNQDTHTQSFSSLFFWVGQYQKDKPFWIFWSRDDGVAVASARPYASHLHFAPDR